MDVEPSHDHPVLATAVPVATVVVLHVAASTAIIAAVDPDVPDIVPYWFVSALLPSVAWALLVIGRAAVWRTRSAFWLGGSAGILVLAAFLFALVIYIGDISRLGGISARGVPMALLISSWVLLGCAVIVAVVLFALGKHTDAPIDARDDPAPAPSPSDAAAGGSDLSWAEQDADAMDQTPAEDGTRAAERSPTERR